MHCHFACCRRFLYVNIARRAWALGQHFKACDVKHEKKPTHFFFYHQPLWNLGKHDYFATVWYCKENNSVSIFTVWTWHRHCYVDPKTCWNKHSQDESCIKRVSFFFFFFLTSLSRQSDKLLIIIQIWSHDDNFLRQEIKADTFWNLGKEANK